MPDQRRGDRPRGRLIDRHTALVGATHWINVLFLTILLVCKSATLIQRSTGVRYLSMTAQRTKGGASRGINTVASHQFDTTFPLRFLLLAHFGHDAMPDLSPLCAPKRAP